MNVNATVSLIHVNYDNQNARVQIQLQRQAGKAAVIQN